MYEASSSRALQNPAKGGRIVSLGINPAIIARGIAAQKKARLAPARPPRMRAWTVSHGPANPEAGPYWGLGRRH